MFVSTIAYRCLTDRVMRKIDNSVWLGLVVAGERAGLGAVELTTGVAGAGSPDDKPRRAGARSQRARLLSAA